VNFEIVHTTEYEYSELATESFSELRVRPRNTMRQFVSHHQTEVSPRVALEAFQDYYGNWVETLSIPFRHKKLVVTSRSRVQTRDFIDLLTGLQITVSESVHLFFSQRRELHDFLMPSTYCPLVPEVEELARELLPKRKPFGPAMLDLNEFIYKNFKYEPGTTTVGTPIQDVIKNRRGVCQDFAHLMIALIRAAGLPVRYVSGYLETDDQAAISAEALECENKVNQGMAPSWSRQLRGGAASHAWVEVYTPSGHWVGLDPTNQIQEGERHVQIGVGRDYADVPPLRGSFKGARQQFLSVQVVVSRLSEAQVATSARAE
jgi:transglutaminase-like putative cysteine protease